MLACTVYVVNRTTYIFSMGATVQTECNIRRYCTLLGVILHVAKTDIALLTETMYNVRLTIIINSMVERTRNWHW